MEHGQPPLNPSERAAKDAAEMTEKVPLPEEVRRAQTRTNWVFRAQVAAVFLIVSILSIADQAEIIPAMAPFTASPIFPYLHEPHDVVALIACLFAAHFFGARIGRAATLYFLAIHIPYAAIVIPRGELPEILRLLFMGGAALFAVQLIAIRRRIESQLSDLALSDPLTSVANSRYFVAELGKMLAQTRRYSVQGSILFMDLDGFKAVNERLGHPGADHVLRSVATQLRRGVRETDLLARMGGDEFAVLLPYTDRGRAVHVAERLLDSLHRLKLTGEAKGLRISASIGVAGFPEDGTAVEELLAAADRAMYLAKELGRGQVVEVRTPSPGASAEAPS